MNDQLLNSTRPFTSETAKSDFEQALIKGFWREVISWLTQSSNDLLPFDEIRKRLPFKGQHDVGLCQISIDQIIGSVGRYHDFDRAFLPRYRHTAVRWMSIDSAHLQDIELPPIEVYQVGTVYFVRDGNHRVSVARKRGQTFIDAYVTVIEVSVPIDANVNIDDLIMKQEQAEFLEKTHLNKCCPQAEILLTLPGGYSKLIEHIETHRWFMGVEQKSEVSDDEAVCSWYEEVYLPLVLVIRENKILGDFPGRSEADLYLWIIEHLYYLREEFNGEITMQEAAIHFAEEYAPKGLMSVVIMLRKAAHTLVEGRREEAPIDKEKLKVENEWSYE